MESVQVSFQLLQMSPFTLIALVELLIEAGQEPHSGEIALNLDVEAVCLLPLVFAHLHQARHHLNRNLDNSCQYFIVMSSSCGYLEKTDRVWVLSLQTINIEEGL